MNEAESAANELKVKEIHLRNKLESLARELNYYAEQQSHIHQAIESQQSQIQSENDELEEMVLISRINTRIKKSKKKG